MFGFLNKTTPEEIQKAATFSKIIDKVNMVNRCSYRKNGKFEVMFNGGVGELTDPENQAMFNLLAHSWINIWGDDKAELHVGVTNKMGYRLTIGSSALYIGHKYNDHENRLDEILGQVGVTRG